jgi:hypothetical protein
VPAAVEHFDQKRHRVDAFELARGDRDLELHVGRRVGGRPQHDRVAHGGGAAALIPRGADGPGADGGVLVGQQLCVERRVQRARADQRPQRVQPLRARRATPIDQFTQRRARIPSFRQQPLRRLAEEEVVAPEPPDELRVVLGTEVERGNRRRVGRPQAVQPPLCAVDALRVACRVLRAVVTVVPVEHVEAAVGTHLQRHRHEPDVIGGQQVGLGPGDISRAVALQPVGVDAPAVQVAHQDPAAPRFGEQR